MPNVSVIGFYMTKKDSTSFITGASVLKETA